MISRVSGIQRVWYNNNQEICECAVYNSANISLIPTDGVDANASCGALLGDVLVLVLEDLPSAPDVEPEPPLEALAYPARDAF